MLVSMSDISQRYRRLADTFTSYVSQVPDERWSNPSPCEGWTARDLVRHLVEVQGMPLAPFERSLGDIPSVDEGPLAAWAAARDVLQAYLEDREWARAEYDGYFGRTTLEQTVDDFICFDLVIHRWDLARATGLDERLELDEVRRISEQTASLGDAMRGPRTFGPAVEAPPGANEQARLLAFLGRQP